MYIYTDAIACISNAQTCRAQGHNTYVLMMIHKSESVSA